jgi:hypothetical protein
MSADAIEPIETGRPVHDRFDRVGVWVRRAAMGALTAVVIAALCNTFGQRASVVHATGPLASLELRAPATVRPGLLFQAKITITPRQMLPSTHLVLGSGWFDGLTLNTEEPGASTETSGPDGSVVLDLGTLPAGQPFVEYLEYQVNPTSLSRRTQTLAVLSNGVTAASMRRTLTITP